MQDAITYSIEHLKIQPHTDKKDLLLLLKKHDRDSYEFSFWTGMFNIAIAKELNIDKSEHELLFLCGLFHDIGKLGMSSYFLNYPGRYTMEMFNEMKKHTTGGATILQQINGTPSEIVETTHYHHCNYDGSGYPLPKEGKAIPLTARITRVSDSADAYLSKRCYKEGGPAREVFEDLNSFRGKSYDPEVLDAFKSVHSLIMEQSHLIGEDYPSKDMYMHILTEWYAYDFPVRTPEDLIDNINLLKKHWK